MKIYADKLRFRMKTIIAILSAITICILCGCATLNPGVDPIEVRAEQTLSVAFATMDTFLKLAHQQEARLKTVAPQVLKFADWLREPQPDGLPRGASLVASANRVRQAYKSNRSADNKASLVTALAIVESAVSETNRQLANAH